MIIKIISGGQSGADQAGLAVSRNLGIRTGGFAPKDFLTENGPNLKLRDRYGLVEFEGGYKDRTYENVRISNGTIRCAVDFFSSGEICTLNAVKKYNKPYFDVYLLNPPSSDLLIQWILKNQIKVLNISGNRQNTRGFDIYNLTCKYLLKALKNLKSTPL